MTENTKYPKPDRSDYKPEEHPEEVELRQFEGVLADGRPFRAEVWWWDGFKGVTYLFSKRGLEHATSKDTFDLLTASGVLEDVVPPNWRRPAEMLGTIIDARGEPMWSDSYHLGTASKISFKENGEWKMKVE